VPVTIEIEPDRVAVPSKATRENPSEESNRIFERLVAEGLRAQIVAGNLLLGQRVIALDFVPGAPPARLVQANPYPELPTVPGTDIQDIATSTGKLVEAFATLPLDRLISEIHGMVSHADNLLASPEVKHALQELDRTLGNTRRLTHDAQVQTGPLLASFKSASDQLQATVAILGRDPSSSNDMLQTLTELKNAARSVRVLADYLERHPESLLRGKPQDTAR
jgi:paraquat-inducible protein B